MLVDGAPAGRLYLQRAAAETCLVDIALLPEFRGAGNGTYLLGQILAEAAGTGVPVRLHVAAQSRARSLYRRLGFVETDSAPVHVRMEWTPPSRRSQANTAS